MEPDYDLPLVSNVEDVLVRHYSFTFDCSFETHCFACSAVLFLETVGSECCTCGSQAFVLLLDCHRLAVERVEEVGGGGALRFSSSEWCLKVWREGATCKRCFPNALRVVYRTLPSGPSLLWTLDQDGSPAVFTHGSPVNNRALFPCQEPPIAMATWEAVVSVPEPYTVLMSGEPNGSQGGGRYSYRMDQPLPLSTLCLAIGRWKGRHIPTHPGGPTCRMFACPSLLEKCMTEFSGYIPVAVRSSEELLGRYPFPRIDFLVVPPAFGSLGMASPNVVFVSQSVIGELGRLSHEVSHAWFGLSVGAADWTEEWLSEGFATFAEDVVHAHATRMENVDDFMELKALIRQKTLCTEVDNTKEELQILRPSFGETKEAVVEGGVRVPVLKNGLDPIKNFTQVHYIKGYFLLKHMSNSIGVRAFMKFLGMYAKKYAGQLVTSREFLTLFYHEFPSFGDTLSVEELYEKWLHGFGVPEDIANFKPRSDNKLYKEVVAETKKWRKFNSAFCGKKRKKLKFDLEDFIPLSSEQLVLVLENLLLLRRMSGRTLDHLQLAYRFPTQSAEVQHRWFELVVAHHHRSQYPELQKFLTDHMAMGVYLWAELLHSREAEQEQMGRGLYSRLRDSMEPSYRSTIDRWLCGP